MIHDFLNEVFKNEKFRILPFEKNELNEFRKSLPFDVEFYPIVSSEDEIIGKIQIVYQKNQISVEIFSEFQRKFHPVIQNHYLRSDIKEKTRDWIYKNSIHRVRITSGLTEIV